VVVGSVNTSLCQLLGLDVPIIQAPIGGASNPALAAAVSEAGGLGMLAITWREPGEIVQLLRETRRLTARPFGVNLVLKWPPGEKLAVALAEGASVVSFSWGDATPHLATVHAAGARALVTVATPDEARAAVDAGADAVVAQGWEAGGHVQGEIATMALVPAVVDAVGPAPVVAAGGIADGRGLAAALALGAAGVWLGTRFVATHESGANPRYKERLLRARATETVIDDLFDGGWPHDAHRVLRNATVAAWEAAGRPAPGSRPGEGEAIARAADGGTILRYDSDSPLASTTGDVEAMALYAGQSVELCRRLESAGDVVRRIAREARVALAALGATA
jgi:NAD(P)H-dependent flavin oxidoreductase YrpB (nitropropane dioxygenase family)